MDSSDPKTRLPEFLGGLREAVAPAPARLDEADRALESQAAALHDRLRLFFAGLAPAIEIARSAQAELDRLLATQFSIFDDFFHFIHKKENTLSRIFGTILDPAGRHGQGSRFLAALLEEVRVATDSGRSNNVEGEDGGAAREYALPSADPGCRVHAEYSIRKTDRRRGSIDLVIEWPSSRYWIGIENKPWAGEQSGQIHDYFEALLGLCRRDDTLRAPMDRVLVLYFSGNGADPTTAPKDLERRARCITIPYRATSGGASVEGWLRRCRAACEAERIRWFLAELEDYIQKQPHFRPDSEPEPDEGGSDAGEHPD